MGERRLGRHEADRQLLQRAVQVRALAARLAGELAAREAREELLEEDPPLEARELGAEAELLSEAEGELRVGVPPCVEAVGVREDFLVAVRRGVHHHHLVALAGAPTAQLGVARAVWRK